tara:strand:- start:4060 stop:5331 length:1272 start_codon:yes stop_codon:yes gene_type:complete
MDSLTNKFKDLFLNFIWRRSANKAHKELEKSVSATLMLFNQELYLIESGKSVRLSDNWGTDELAAKGKELLGYFKEPPSIQLLLPSGDFLATRHSLPDLPKNNLISALRLQVEETLPSFDKPVAIALNSQSSVVGKETIVLWKDQEELDNLYLAFQKQDLFLAVVEPRILALQASGEIDGFLERDGLNETLVIFENSVLKTWQQAHKVDLAQDEFLDQWNTTISDQNHTSIFEIDELEKIRTLTIKPEGSGYPFFPNGAITARQEVERGRKVISVFTVLIVLLCLAALPFVRQSIEFRSAASSLEASRVMSSEARQDQQVVVNFEDRWGPLNDFPEQQLRQVMFTLQNVLGAERISSMEVSEGLIKLQGSSADPQAILQKLEQDPLFTEVLFSRATSNTRYYIDLRLSPVNFEAYMVRYFPEN